MTLTGHALFVTGNMVVLGSLSATEVHASGDPFTLTVMGEVNVGLAVMERQFIMQFLGGGTVERVVDTKGGADELVELWRDVKVKPTSDEL